MARLFLVPLLLAALVAAQGTPKCQNGGRWVEETQSCRCKNGFSGRHCSIDVVCCLVWGDPHYLTFDGARINFQGSCSYHLFFWCPCIVGKLPNKHKSDLSVVGKNWRRGKTTTRASWARDIITTVNGTKITLTQDKMVFVDGAEVTLPYNTGAATIRYSGEFVRLETNDGAAVSFDGRGRAIICIPKIWNDICGICGDKDGDKKNDYKTKDGTDVFSFTKRDRDTIIGNSWALKGDDDNCRTVKHDVSPRPSKKWNTIVKKKEWCGLTIDTKSVFKDCIAHLGNDKVNAFFENCQYDVFETAQDPKLAKEMACESLAALSEECEERGFNVIGWRKLSQCPMTCTAGQVFSYETSPCPPTCSNPNAPKTCERPTVEGCMCKPGTILSGKECVKMAECACTDEHGSYHKVGEKWFSKDCRTQHQCKSAKAGAIPTIQNTPGCKADETCKAVNGVMQCVKIPVPGGWSDWGKYSDCVKFACDDYLVRVKVRTCDNPAPQNGGTCKGEAFEVTPCIGKE